MIYNLFVSYSWDYPKDHERLDALLRKRGYFDFRDYSVDEEDPKNNWREIENIIKHSTIVIVIVGVYASYSPSIKREIKIAKEYSKPTLAIIPYGNDRSSDLRNECDAVVGWNANSIVTAIRNLANGQR